MRRQYASSVYSQKSTTSAKSGRSFLSLATPIWPSSSSSNTNKEPAKDDITLNEAKQGVWQSLKNWIPSNNNSIASTKKKKNDEDSIATRSSTSSSISKLKQLFVASNNKSKKASSPFSIIGANSSSPRSSLDILELQAEADSVSSSSDNKPSPLSNKSSTGPIGILTNRGEDSAEAIAERKKRRHQRRENILKLQKHHRSLHRHQQSQFPHHQNPQLESSSSDTLLTDDLDHYNHPDSSKRTVAFHNDEEEDENDRWGYNPRIMFVEPSPVPRFRNVAPPPPPSPVYLNILIDKELEGTDNIQSVIKSPSTEEEDPIIFASKDTILAKNQPPPHETEEDKWRIDDNNFMDEHDRLISLLIENLKPRPPLKPRLCFYAPFRRGQTLKFSLQNTIPDDHIILFKFLTSNVSPNIKGQPERYFVRPSAGRMVSTDQTDIVLFLNQIPVHAEYEKDKIMIRWAAIQKGTEIEEWANSLQEATRRKWIDMLDEQWPNQVTIRMTRIKVRFSA